MRKKLPKHNELRVRYPLSLIKRYINGYVIQFERYKLTERYDDADNKWVFYSKDIDDRDGIVSIKEESKTMGGPY